MPVQRDNCSTLHLKKNTLGKEGILICLLATLFLTSCTLLKKDPEVIMDYYGPMESFEYYSKQMRKVRGMGIQPGSLEESIQNSSDAVFLDFNSETKSSYMLILMENRKDILTGFPLAYELSAYNNISDFMNMHGRKVCILNPLEFFPAIKELKDLIQDEEVDLSEIRINCHPSNLGGGFSSEGYTGSAQHLLQTVSFISGEYPTGLSADSNQNGDPSGIEISFPEFRLAIRFDQEHMGWDMQCSGNLKSGEIFTATADHTGMLAVKGEVEPRIMADPGVMDEAIQANIQDFFTSIQQRKEPRVGHVDGLASIMLNKAVKESIESGTVINL